MDDKSGLTNSTTSREFFAETTQSLRTWTADVEPGTQMMPLSGVILRTVLNALVALAIVLIARFLADAQVWLFLAVPTVALITFVGSFGHVAPKR